MISSAEVQTHRLASGHAERRFRAGRGWTGMVLSLGLGLLLAEPVDAQTAKYGAGFTLGASYVTELNSGAVGVGGATPVELKPETGFLFGIHADSWYGEQRRIGVRYQGAYQHPEVPWTNGDRGINAFSADVSVLFRPIVPEPDEQVIPYLAAGLGGIWYDLGRGPQTNYAPADAYYDGSSRVMPSAQVGIGVDVLLPPSLEWYALPIRVRLEAADYISFHSPIKQLSQTDRYGAVHHFRLTLGAYSAFGR
jgi:hypothetical protein